MAIVGFDQDPELPYGAGLFHSDDGRSLFAHNPDLAAQFPQQRELQDLERSIQKRRPEVMQQRLDAGEFDQPQGPPPEDQDWKGPYDTEMDEGYDGMSSLDRGPDMRTAGIADRADIDAITRDLAGGQQAPAAPRSVSDVQPARVIQEAAPPPPPPQNMPQVPADVSQRRASDLAANTAEYVNRPVQVAGTRGGVVPTTQGMTVETQGMPYDPDSPQAMDRRAAHIAVQQAQVNTAESVAAREAGAALAYRAALPELQQKAAEAERVQAIRRRGYEAERKQLDDMTKASEQQTKSFDANRFYQRAGAVGQIGAAIAQAFGAYAATLRGGPNLIAQQIHEYIDADVANQRAEIEAGKAGVNNQLAKMNRQFGDLDQAEAALKIAQQKVADNMAASYASSTKSEDVMNSLNSYLAEGQQRYVQNEQQFEDRSYGKRSVTTAAKMIAPSAGGLRAPTEEEKIKRLTTLGKFGEVQKGAYEGEITRQKAEGQDPEKRKKAEDKAAEEAERYGAKIEGAKLNEYTASIANVKNRLKEYAGKDEIPGVGPENVLTRANRSVDEFVVGPGEAEKRFYNIEERNNRQAVEFMKADMRHAITGAGMTDKERQNLDNMIEAARTGDDFRNVVKIVEGRIDAHKAELARGFSPEAVQLYESRGARAPLPQRSIQK